MSSNLKIRARQAGAWLPITLMLAAFAGLAFRRAWASDDAFITFRTVDNFINGYRLTWNTVERVQGYTHPLWMFLVSGFAFFSRECYYTSILLSLAISLGTAILVALRLCPVHLAAVSGLAVLCLSNAYVDYATSGLENPLSHLLLAGFLVLYFKPGKNRARLFHLSFAASLVAVNRLDTFLVYLPMLAAAWLETTGKKGGLLALACGQLPLLGWEVFSIAYYGFPFPNTAYAKLNNSIPQGELAVQGLRYLANSLQRDPLTLTATLAGVLAAAFSRSWRQRALAIGILCYLAYTVWIGGDFMGGRYFTLPLLAGVILLTNSNLWTCRPKAGLALGAILALIGLAAPVKAWQVQLPKNLPVVDAHGIADERAWYFKDLGLLNNWRNGGPAMEGARQGGLAAREASGEDLYLVDAVKNVGVFGYYAGPRVFIIDRYGLTEPLLARIPPRREMGWRIGHFRRIVPAGYLETCYWGTSRLEDASLGAFYDQLALITRGSLFSAGRWAAIWKMNTGQLDALVNREVYRFPDSIRLARGELATPVTLNENGAEVLLAEEPGFSAIEAGLDGDDNWEIILYDGEDVVLDAGLGATGQTGRANRIIRLPSSLVGRRINRLRLLPASGTEPYRYFGLRLIP